MTSENNSGRGHWYERAVSLGGVIGSICVVLVSLVVFIEQRWSLNDRRIAVLQDRQAAIETKNAEQDARLNQLRADGVARLEALAADVAAIRETLAAGATPVLHSRAAPRHK
jgi:hypothetical protein